jgi:cell division protein FtsB
MTSDVIPFSNAGPLVIFESTRREIAEANTPDQVNHIIVAVTSIAAAARAAANREIEVEARALRLEAERKLGQLMKAQAETVGLATGGDATRVARGKQNPEQKPTLAQAGINKNLAKRARVAAAMSDSEFEAAKESERTAVRTRTKPKQSEKTKLKPPAKSATKKHRSATKIERANKTATRISKLKATITSLKKENRELKSENVDLKSKLREVGDELFMRRIEFNDLLDEAVAVLTRCFQLLGSNKGDIEKLLSDDLFDYWQEREKNVTKSDVMTPMSNAAVTTSPADDGIPSVLPAHSPKQEK